MGRLPLTVLQRGAGPSGSLLLQLQDSVLKATGPGGKQEPQSGVIEAGHAGHHGQPVQEAQVPADDEDHLEGTGQCLSPGLGSLPRTTPAADSVQGVVAAVLVWGAATPRGLAF